MAVFYIFLKVLVKVIDFLDIVFCWIKKLLSVPLE